RWSLGLVGRSRSMTASWVGSLGCNPGGTVITAGLAVAGHIDHRSRVLTGRVTVAVILGLYLFRRENYDRVLATSPRRVIDGGPPTGQALSPAGPGQHAGGVRAGRSGDAGAGRGGYT